MKRTNHRESETSGWWLMVLVTIMLLLTTAPTWAQSSDQEPKTDTVSEEPAESDDTDEESEPAASFYGVTTVTVTGSEIDTFKVAPPVIVIDAQEIEQQMPNNAADLLRTQPGVDLNGVGPNQARPIIRGQRGLRVLFLENGLRMNNARRQSDFGEITGLVDIDNVQTMEVVRGPASVLYGSDAIGGVLNLITQTPPMGPGSEFQFGFGVRASTADEQAKITAGIDGHSGALSYRLFGSYRDTSDYDAPAGSFGDIRLEQDTPVIDTGIQDDSISGQIGWLFHDRHSIYGRFNRYRAGETGFGFVPGEAIGDDSGFRIRIRYPFQDFDRFTVGYDAADLDTAIADTTDVKVYYQQNQRELQNDIFINIGPAFGPGPDSSVESETLNFSDISTWGLRGSFTKNAGQRNLVTYGVEYYDDDSYNTDFSTTTTTLRANFPISFICGPAGATPPPPFECEFVDTDDVANAPNAENTSAGVFLQDEWFATNRLNLTGGLRYSTVDTKANPTPGWDTTGLDFSDDGVVGSINFSFAATEALRIVGGYGTAFRAPNIIERLFNGLTPEGAGYQILNPDLKSETSKNYDFGLKYRRARAYFEAIYFNTEIDDAIIQYSLTDEEIGMLPEDVQDEIDQAGVSFVVQQRNAEVYKVDGFEISGGYRFDMGIALGANYTTLDGQAVFGGPAASPVGDTYSSKIAGFVRYDQPRGRFWAEYRVRHNGEQDLFVDDGTAPGPLGEVLPAFTVHTLAGGVNLFENQRQGHALTLMVDNFTNALYAEFSNATFFRPESKRNYIASYRLRLK